MQTKKSKPLKAGKKKLVSSKNKKKVKKTTYVSSAWENSIHYKLFQIAKENPEVRLDMLLF